MEEEVTVWDGRYKRKLLKINCKECGKELLIRKSRKHSGLCRSCKFSGDKNPMYGRTPVNKLKEWEESYPRRIRRERKREVILMMGNKCARCGVENLPLCCYTAHHIDPETKCFSVLCSLNHNSYEKNKDMLLEEIEKCELLCLHCHKIHHYGDERAE